jgi:D-3-phosphoglycerate dehydrogenase
MGDKRILLGTFPFGTTGSKPLEILRQTGWELVVNPYGRRLKSGEVIEHIQNVDAVIAGTEPYNSETLKASKRLKLICRVGIGLDSVDLEFCRQQGIGVTYTPNAPSQGVAEMTVGFIISLLRHIPQSDASVREGLWNRLMGLLLREAKIGVLGVGRIGNIVINLLQPFNPTILAHDSNPEVHGRPIPNVEWVDLDQLLIHSDILSLHIPMNKRNHHFIGRYQIAKMKTGAIIINTSRGGVLDEGALYNALIQRHLGGSALDVFEKEPYEGPLTRLDNVILTAHMGASARGSRYLMELGAAEDCVRVLNGEAPKHDAIAESQE